MTYQQIETKTNVPISLFCHWGGGSTDDFLKSPPLKSNGYFSFFFF